MTSLIFNRAFEHVLNGLDPRLVATRREPLGKEVGGCEVFNEEDGYVVFSPFKQKAENPGMSIRCLQERQAIRLFTTDLDTTVATLIRAR